MDKEQFNLDGRPFIELNNLLKILGWCSSGGGEAKILIADGKVKVDGKIKLRKRCKIQKNNVVEFMGNSVVVTSI